MNTHFRPMAAAATAALAGLAFVGCATRTPAAVEPTSVYAWNRVALDAVAQAKPTQHQVVRLLAYVSLAQHAAANEAPGDDGAMAGASGAVIAALLPSQAAAVQARLSAAHPKHSARGAAIAERVLARAQVDGFARAWTGTQPAAADAWRSLASPPAPPAYPAVGGMRTFFIPSGDALRAAAPPERDSQRFADDLAEVRRHVLQPTPDTTRLARFYEMTSGTMAGGFWNERAIEAMQRESLTARQATVVLATLNMAMLDALVACHESKYRYWVPRPSQVDGSIKAMIGVPNHPSYPSNHACLSTAAGEVLGHFVPAVRAQAAAAAGDAGLSRIYAGIHYRFDVDAGALIGRGVAAAALARHPAVLAQSVSVASAGQ